MVIKGKKLGLIKKDIETMERISDMIGDLMLELEKIRKGNLKSLLSFKELEELVSKYNPIYNARRYIVRLDDKAFGKYQNRLMEIKELIERIKEALEKEELELIPSKNLELR